MKYLCLSLALMFACFFSFASAQEKADSMAFLAFMDYAVKEKMAEKETGERVASIARYFLDRPYVASTLEADGPERLQVNFQELDCTTFVETVLALHNVLKEKEPGYEAYKSILTSIRYRNGVLAGYPSRLHYTTDWLLDNHRKGFVDFVRMGCASETFKPAVGFMSTHPDSYPALKNNPEFVEEIAKHESRINGLSLKYMPKEKLNPKASFIHTGDIITITTGFKGLDFSHLGFALRENGVVYLLHASSSGKKVLISNQSLKDYLSDIKRHTGIVVVRPQ
ncbi:MAG: DUF1460 domain-containing protein [Bacteroidales bacterium]|nr:DUF1460 domain-containing protein [Bacteroidales bacterium]